MCAVLGVFDVFNSGSYWTALNIDCKRGKKERQEYVSHYLMSTLEACDLKVPTNSVRMVLLLTGTGSGGLAL